MTLQRRSGFPAAFAAAAGILFAAWLYGAAVIDPRSSGWLLLGGDSAQHYIGFVYFLNQPWHWPPGLILQFGDPTSVVFTDSIPLLAFPAKALGLAGRWQYFGLWIVACHALAGWFGARLLQRFGCGNAAASIGALFFVISPTILLRAYGHESLMGQFLVIAALERALRPQWRARGWLLLAVVALVVHAYLATMVLVLGAAAAVAAWVNGTERVGKLALEGVVALVVMAAVAWPAGYLVGAGDFVALGYGHFSANLLTWVDPMDWAGFNRFWGREVPYAREWSRFLPAQQQATVGQYEGFAYLGAGMLGLAALAIVAALRKRNEPVLANVRWVVAACVAMVLLAVSTRVTFGGATLLHLPLPPELEGKLGAFRAGGRFVWPLTFLVMAWAVARVASLRGGVALLVLAVIVQCADLSGKAHEFRKRFRQPSAEPAVAEYAAAWRALLAKCPRVEMVSAKHPGEGWAGPAIAAGESGALFTPAPTVRYSQQLERERVAHVEALFQGGLWRRDTIYLLAPPLPAAVTLESLDKALPAGMRRLRVGPSDVLFDTRCAGA
ncbi:DUF6311 domain-containing protein [Ramlibacter sp. PS4R-6]|uniref:DUF6311 domain-containing protein n=1 Tax=Ramlibacter sp. PS4R-6 TaxID=3133438 RepID=UPI003097E58D